MMDVFVRIISSQSNTCSCLRTARYWHQIFIDITKLFYISINGDYNEVEQVSGFIDNQEQIDELQEQIDELLLDYKESDDEQNDAIIMAKIDELQEKIDELQEEQDNPPEIFQYFIVSDAGADLLKDYGEIVYYLPALDIYIWGVV